MIWIVGTVALRMALGLGAALVFNAKVRGTVWMRVLAVLPWTIPSVVGANLWRWIVQTDTGVLNQTLRAWGLGDWALNWLGDPDDRASHRHRRLFVERLPLRHAAHPGPAAGHPGGALRGGARIDGANWWQMLPPHHHALAEGRADCCR